MRSLSTVLALATGAAIIADAFLLPPVKTTGPSTASSSSTVLFDANKNLSRVQKAGGGVPQVPSGDRHSFWDPASEGMRGMDGDMSLEERLAFGTDFHLDGDYDLGDDASYDTSYSSPASSSSPSASSSSVSSYLPYNKSPVPDLLHAAQCWLEDIDDNPNRVPPAFCTAKKPAEATVLGRTRLIDADAPGDIQHIVMKLPDGFRYVEGQSLSVIPPGVDARGKPHKPRLYSIASTRYGDLLDGQTVSLCVRRAEYHDPATGLPDPTKAGVCSGFLCDATPGTPVKVAGPVGKTMVLPEDPTKDVIMVATGTGIAPFRSFLHRLYTEHTIARQVYTGDTWLVLGVPTTGSLLYKPEFDAMQQQVRTRPGEGGGLTIDYAISREMKNASGGKLYVQDVLKQKSEELFRKLESGNAVIYFCGLKGMMPGILSALEEVATAQGIDWSTALKKYQKNHQWHVEVY